MKPKMESYSYIGAVYTRFSIHRTFRKQTPGFRVAFGAVVGATEISGIRRFLSLKDANEAGRGKKMPVEGTNR